MKNRKILAPRNPFVAAAKFKKAGVHRKASKAIRRQEKVNLRNLSSDGSSNRLLTGRSRVRTAQVPPKNNYKRIIFHIFL